MCGAPVIGQTAPGPAPAGPADLPATGRPRPSRAPATGGGRGLEIAVAAGGPALTLISILTFAVLVSLPCALMTAELSSALPGRGGVV